MKYKLIDFAAIAAFVLAAIGGTAYLFYFHQPLFGVTNIILSLMALPALKECLDDLIK